MKENLGNIMIDIESFGNKSQGALVSIAAVEFNMETGEIGKIFDENCSIQSSLDVGLNVDGSTIAWWMSQSDEARKQVIKGSQHISNMLRNFTLFIEDLGTGNLQIWGNSNRFDMGIIENAYNALNKKIPWKYTLERDVRTLVSFYPEFKKESIFEGVKHNPVDDCMYQIKYCVKTYEKLMK